jgi:acid phosphatase type 7
MSSSALRQVLLGAVVFVAAFGILLGLTAVIRPGERGGPGSAPSPAGSTPPATAASPSPPATPSGTVDGSAAPSGSAAASAPAATTATLVGAGDIAGCDWDGDEQTAALLDGIDGTIFTAGDNVYPAGRTDTYADCFGPSWGRHRDRIRPAPGNHDWELGTLDAYRAYFGDAARNENGDPWYAYPLGSWQVIVLDSDCSDVGGCGPESPQGRWLAETLAASDAVCTLAIWHHPRFSSGTHGSDPSVAPFWDALSAASADVVVNGHEHDYERFAPQDPAGSLDRERGLRQFIVGTGGVELRDFETPIANSELRLAVGHGVIEFTLGDGGYEWQWLPVTGEVADRGQASCH